MRSMEALPSSAEEARSEAEGPGVGAYLGYRYSGEYRTSPAIAPTFPLAVPSLIYPASTFTAPGVFGPPPFGSTWLAVGSSVRYGSAQLFALMLPGPCVPGPPPACAGFGTLLASTLSVHAGPSPPPPCAARFTSNPST